MEQLQEYAIYMIYKITYCSNIIGEKPTLSVGKNELQSGVPICYLLQPIDFDPDNYLR